MRTSSYFPPYLSLIRLLTYASVIGSQFHGLFITAVSVLEERAPVTNFNIEVFNATSTISNSRAGATISTSAVTFAISTTTVSTLNDSRTSVVMSSSNVDGGNISGGSSSTSVTPNVTFASTVSAPLKTLKGITKFPIDFSFSKNHWSSSDAISFGGSSPSATVETTDRSRTFRNKHHHEHHWGPFFEEPLNSTASGGKLISTAHLFTEAVLNCRVGMLKDKTVMWVRRTTEKVSLLTVGNITYSGDPRIRVKFQYPNNWRLLINPTQREDAGVYMCQVSTHPPRVFTTNLTILEPPLRLIDDQEREMSDRYYKSGSTIDLQCQVSKRFLLKEKLNVLKSIQLTSQQNQSKFSTLKNSAATILGAGYNELFMGANQTGKQAQSVEKQFSNFIFWKKDDEVLSTLALKRPSTTDKWINIRVSIPDAKLSDSGNYSCSIGKLFTAIVQVQVLTGELPAAVQHNFASRHANIQLLLLLLPLLLLHPGCVRHLADVFTIVPVSYRLSLPLAAACAEHFYD